VARPGATTTGAIARIGGLPILKGLILDGATLTFAGLYIHFIVDIFTAKSGVPPTFSSTTVTAAAALAGVLGSAFALVIGNPTDKASTNVSLGSALSKPRDTRVEQVSVPIRKWLSLEPSSTTAASWPMTFGIWVYAIVGSAVAITYALNQSETPGPIKSLAVVFGGYVIALITAAYGITGKDQ
jgi:hypothetical protein